MNHAELIYRLARFLDQQNKPDAPIAVSVSRATLVQSFKASDAKRGDPLFVGKHPLVIVKPSSAGDDQTQDMFGPGTQGHRKSGQVRHA